MKKSKKIQDLKKILKRIPYLLKIKRNIQYKFFPPIHPNIADIIRMRGEIVNTIVHVGAHAGQEIDEYLSLMPSRIVLIEADPDTFRVLKKNVEDNYSSYKNMFYIFNELISEADGKPLKFYRFTNSQSSSVFMASDLLRETWDGLGETGEVLMLESMTLKGVLSREKIDISGLSILTLDIQGSELNALRGLGNEICKFQYIEVEVSFEEVYKGGVLFEELNRYLESMGFQIIGVAQWHGDAVYERIGR